MSTVHLLAEDLDALQSLANDLNFNDEERRSALLENGSRDFNAVPGSGKTSLLAAKLLLLAKKWPHTRRGICVLSHTTVARDEITRRLAKTPEGAQLLSYPHFIGTIHSFINHFFALPMLKSRGQTVDVIDDVVFATKAKSFLQRSQFVGLRMYLDNQSNGEGIATTLFYGSAELGIQVESGRLPAEHTNSYKSLTQLKTLLTQAGFFRHRDMFAYANLALLTCPQLLDVVHRRFPMVFIDEMQDTSWEQESFLNRIFDGKSTMQRLGDVDQKILSDEKDAHNLTFPRAGYGSISTSKRFGSVIANAVESVRVSGDSVIGEGTNNHSPTLLLYSTTEITEVVPHFGRLVLDRLSAKEIGTLEVKVMSARKTGEGKVEPGRHLVDYWPNYAYDLQDKSMRSENFWELVGDAGESLLEPTLSSRVADIRRALLLVLRAAGATLAQGIRDARALPRAARELLPSGPIEKLTRLLTIHSERLNKAARYSTLFRLIYTGLKPYLPETLTFDAFKALSVFNRKTTYITTAYTTKPTVFHNSRQLEYCLGTIAGMKGETHVASLILESYGGHSRKFDIELALQYIAGLPPKGLANPRKLPKTQQAQMRNLYVAMSRPTTLLCLAANQSRVSQNLRDTLTSKGWKIELIGSE